jgi:NAD(P)H-dependent FMN reductase
MSVSQKHLLLIYHSRSGANQRLVDAVQAGVERDPSNVTLRIKTAFAADEADLLWANATIFVSPEHFGYMAGALKDFFERTFYPTENQVAGRSISIVIGTGLDGQGALASIRKICTGYRFKEVQPPIIVVGPPTEDDLTACETLGATFAAGLEAGIF